MFQEGFFGVHNSIYMPRFQFEMNSICWSDPTAINTTCNCEVCIKFMLSNITPFEKTKKNLTHHKLHSIELMGTLQHGLAEQVWKPDSLTK
jgi:hypothetical protein